MAFQVNIQTGKTPNARRVLLYGGHGVGKSSWAAKAPNVLFLNLEDGLDDIDCHKTDRLVEFEQVMEVLRWVYETEPDYKWIAIDTLDWLEQVIFRKIARMAGKESIAEIGFGNGYKEALSLWDKLLGALDLIRKYKGVGIIMLSHADVKRFSSPQEESYDRYMPSLHDTSSKLLQEWADEVLFASLKVYTKKEDLGFSKERTIALGDGERQLQTTESAGVIAKNRLGLPRIMPFTWEAYAEHLAT